MGRRRHHQHHHRHFGRRRHHLRRIDGCVGALACCFMFAWCFRKAWDRAHARNPEPPQQESPNPEPNAIPGQNQEHEPGRPVQCQNERSAHPAMAVSSVEPVQQPPYVPRLCLAPLQQDPQSAFQGGVNPGHPVSNVDDPPPAYS